MKLKDYFQNKQEFQLSENDKLALYEKIISQQKRKSLSRMVKVKYFAYWLILVVLLFGIYWVYFDSDWDIDWLAVQNPVNQVNADYIAKVVNFNGSYYVQHEWKLTRTSNISNWDNVILKKWSEIVFDIDSWTKAKLTWPARFSLAQDENGYQLLIAEWDFIQMESLEPESAPVEISVWDDFTVSSEKNTNLLITKSDNEYKVNNQWWNIKVTKNGKQTEVKTKELIAINENDITLIQNVEQFQTAFVEQKINQTFEIKEKDKEQLTESLIKELSTWTTVKIENTWLAEELWIMDSKKVPTEEQSKALYTNLDKNSLMRNLENMREYRKLWNEKDYNYSKSQIDTKIQKIYTSFGIKYQKLWTKSDIENLIENLNTLYHIPNTQISNLKTLISWIDYIESSEFGTYAQKDYEETVNDIDIELKRNEFKSALPSNLIFN